MFDLFSRKKKQIILSPERYEKVMGDLTQMINHVQAAAEIEMQRNPHIMEMKLGDARIRIGEVRHEIQSGYTYFQKVIDILPEGEFIFTEIKKMFTALNSFIDNQAEWCELINRPTFDIFNSSDKKKYQQFVINNRRFAEHVEYHKNKMVEFITNHINQGNL